LAAVLIFLTPLVSRTAERDVRLVLFSTTVGALLAAGGVLLVRALRPEAWMSGVGFQDWATIVMAPLLLLATIEALRRAPVPTSRARSAGPRWSDSRVDGYVSYRLQLAQIAAGLFCVVLSTQSLAWWGLTQRLRETLPQSTVPCISRSWLHWTDRTALNHWSIGPLALVLQSQSPDRLVLDGDRCTETRLSGDVALTDWDRWPGQQGWFDLRQVVSRERSNRSCWYTLPSAGAGWYSPEDSGRSWWRWSNGQGTVLLYVDAGGLATLQGSIESLQIPNQVELRLNGERAQTVDVVNRGPQPFAGLPIALQAGLNTLEVRSSNPAEMVSPDIRALAIALGDLSVVPANSQVRCELRP
jgi:hypothetical protein